MLETRYIPKLERSITRIGLGVLPMGPLQRKLSVEDGAKVIRTAIERGITFIDTATVYGTYEHIAKAIKGWTGELTISTKSHAKTDRALAQQHIETALKELGRDVIDIMLCHCARSLFTEEDWGPTLEALISARGKGLIRMVGISSHSIENVRRAARHPEIDAIHPMINMTGMGIIDGTAAEMVAAIREAHGMGKFIYAMKSLAGGNLVTNREEALRFVLGIQEIDALALGMVTPLEVEWNVRFASGQAIPEQLSKDTAIHSKQVNILEMVCIGCGDCAEHCENDALSVENGKAKVDSQKCILCGYCAPHCKLFAIRFV